MWSSGPFHGRVMRLPCPMAKYPTRKFTEGDDHERVAETRDHRVRGWHGSYELSACRARPRLISRVDLTSFRWKWRFSRKWGSPFLFSVPPPAPLPLGARLRLDRPPAQVEANPAMGLPKNLKSTRQAG